jgi:electron transport complex protein RnfE
MNGIYMGLSTMFCLILSNVIISALRKVIPAKVRIPCYIVIIATLVTLMQMIIARFLPDINEILGLYLPLIVVNCIILGRAEAFASSNTPVNSALDAVGMGVGFTLSLTLMGMVREFIGAGALFGVELGNMPDGALTVFILPAGGFLVYGLMMAAFNAIYARYESRKSARNTSPSSRNPIEKVDLAGGNADSAGCHSL